MQIFTRSSHFIGFVVILIVIAILGGYFIRQIIFKKHAKIAYQYLRLKTLNA